MSLPAFSVNTWSLDGLSFNTGPDSLGHAFQVNTSKGWKGSTPPRPDHTARPNSDGDYRGPNYNGPRVVELDGIAQCLTRADRDAMADRLEGICADRDVLYDLVRNEYARSLRLRVEKQARVDVVELPDGVTLTFNIQVVASDGRKFGVAQKSDQTELAQDPADGVLWNGTPGNTGTEWNGPPTLGAVLNANPYFETNTTNWTPSAATFARDVTQFHQGTASGLLTPDGSGSTAYTQSEQFAVTAGSVYLFSMWARCAAGREVTLNVNWFNSSHTYLSTTTAGDLTVAANTWTKVSGSNTAPASAAFATLVPTLYSPASAAQLLYVDEVTAQLSSGAAGAVTGLVYQSSSGNPGTLVIENDGNASTPVRFTISTPPGQPLVRPQLTVAGTGDTIAYNGTMAPGSVLTVDTATGLVLLNGATGSGQLARADFFEVPPHTTYIVQFSAGAPAPGAIASVVWSDAY